MSFNIQGLIASYGYLGIFLLVFSEEIGFPNPVPNELNILFAGSLAASGFLSLPLVFLMAFLGDFLGAVIWYFLFYFFGNQLMKRSPRWLPVKAIQEFEGKISKRKKWVIFFGRLVSYGRKFISMAAGLIKVKPKIFLEMVFWSSVVWTGIFLVIGWSLGPNLNAVINKIGLAHFLIALGVFVVLLLTVYWLTEEFLKKKSERKSPINIQ